MSILPNPLFLLHGFPMDARMWRHTVSYMQADRLVLAPYAGDLMSAETPSMAMMARGAMLSADALAPASRWVVAGLSMGGYVALEIACQFPDRVAALVLCDTRASADTPEGKANRDAMARAVAEQGVLAATAAMREKLLAPETGEDVREELAEMAASRSPDEIASFQMAMRDRKDHTGLLPRISVPTLVVVGEFDTISPIEVAKEMADAIPGAHLAAIPGAGHVPPLENPDAFHRVLADFLDKHRL